MARRSAPKQMTTKQLLETAPSTIVLDAPSVKLIELLHLQRKKKKINEKLFKYTQAGINTLLCENYQTLNNQLEEINAEIETKKGGKRSRKNKKSHKKRAHTKRTHAKRAHKKRARHTRKH